MNLFHLLSRAPVACLLAFAFFLASPAFAAESAGMWCTPMPGALTPVECTSSAAGACLLQYEAFANSNNCCFKGANAAKGWQSAFCKWETFPFGLYPGTVHFKCPDGYSSIAPGRCVKPDEQDEEERPPCRQPSGSNASPATPYPISLLTGSKLLHATDFETADGLLRVSRSYRSTPIGNVEALLYEPIGLGRGWRLDLMPEFHIRPSSNASKVSLHWPDGSSWSFRRQSDGSMKPYSASMTKLPHSEFRLSFEGTWPTDLGTVEDNVTQWKVIDPSGNVWILATFNNFIAEDPPRYRTGLPLSRTTPEGYRLDFTYGTHSELTGITDSFGRSLGFEWILYDESWPPDFPNRPIRPLAIRRITLPDGTALRYSYTPIVAVGTPEEPTDRLVLVEHLAADGVAVLESTAYHYEDPDFPGYVTGITDARGVRAWDFDYDGRGRTISSAKAGGVDGYSVDYSPASATPVWRNVTNPLGRTSRYRYDGLTFTRLVGIDGGATTNCPADAASISYISSGTSSGYISSRTDQEGRVTSYVRDSRGRPTTITEATGTPDQRVTTIAWHATYDVPTSVVKPGLTTTYTYNATGARTSVTQTDTTTHTVPYSTAGQTRNWAFTYTTGGLLDTIDGPLPGTVDVVDYDYDASGYLAQVTNELGHVNAVVSVNGRGQPTSILDPNGVATSIEYDPLGRATFVTRNPGPDEVVTELAYDAVGDITKITRPDGSWLGYTYDDARRVTTITSDLGETITYGYNNASDVTAVDVRSSTGIITASRTLAYDEIGRVRRLIGAGLQETALSYDKVDNPSTMTDPRGGLYDYAFDRLDRLVSEVDPELGETSISYDQRDNITAVEDAENLSTTFVVNGFGDVIRRTSPDTGVTDYVVDARGRATSTTDARGVTTGFTYDALGRVLTKSFPSAPAEDVTYSYDDTTGGNHGVGRLTAFDDPSGSTAYRYDAFGRIEEVSQTIAGDAFTTGYEYDAAGRVAEMTYPSGRVVSFTRDSTGRVISITTEEIASATPETVASDIEYLPFYPAGLFADGAAAPGLDTPHMGGLAGFIHGNGLSLLLNYDADGRLTGMSTAEGLTEVQDLTLAYDAAADITAITDNLDPVRSQTFGYDGVGRLTSASGPYGEIDYTYDLVGNRTHRTIDDGTITDEVYSYGAGSHRLESVTVGAATRAFAYTAAGATSSDSRAGTPLTFAYNHAGRLDSAAAASGTLASREYDYDALQHRVRELREDRVGEGIQASSRSFVYDLDGYLLAEYETGASASEVLREYIWLGDTPIAMVDHTISGEPLLAIHADHLGRPQKLTDASQAMVWDGQFDPFGEEYAVAGTTDLPLRFPGQEWDAATGLSQNWNRDYDPALGRYVESDPIGLMAGAATYTYAAGGPLGATDRRGLSTYSCTIPLHGLGEPWGPRVYDPSSGNPFYHEYVCVLTPSGTLICGGLDRSGNWVRSDGIPSDDKQPPLGMGHCELRSTTSCMDGCVAGRLVDRNRPPYGIGPQGTDCQEWADDVISSCRAACGGGS